MSQGIGVCESYSASGAMERLSHALHDLCQPLTTLQCRLELAELVGTMEAYREAAAVGLEECSRLVETVGSMREILRAARLGEGTNRAGG